MVNKYCDNTSVEEMYRRVEQIAKITDNISKKETQCANNKRNENDEHGVFVELNEDQNETKQKLNSALSDDFIDISIIKTVDEIITDGNKDEAEKNENETDNITEIPVDYTIDEKDKEMHR